MAGSASSDAMKKIGITLKKEIRMFVSIVRMSPMIFGSLFRDETFCATEPEVRFLKKGSRKVDDACVHTVFQDQIQPALDPEIQGKTRGAHQ